MAAPPGDRGDDARLVRLEVADPPEAWEAAGFTVTDGVALVGATEMALGHPADAATGGGIRRWSISGLDVHGGGLDGLPTDVADPSPTMGAEPVAHRSGVTAIDHVVVTTPDLDRTIAALGAAGLGCRRVREAGTPDAPLRQAFFRLGPVVLEVVGGAPPSGDGAGGPSAADAPATWWGLALDVDDLDLAAARLGAGLGPIKAAVQPGRRIATVRDRNFGMSVAVALMDRRGDR